MLFDCYLCSFVHDASTSQRKKLTYLNHPVIDHSSGREIIELHIQTLYV